MKITRTVNADIRYYLDEDFLENPESFVETMFMFNEAKIDLYNHLYNQRFLGTGILVGETKVTACGYVKQAYGTNDYYNAAVYTAASGQISSQKELRKLYEKTVACDIDAREKKIRSVQEDLDKKKAVKSSIRAYIISGKWVKPYPKCSLKVSGKMISGFGTHPEPIEQYERNVERKIRELKNRLAMLQEGLKRKQQKLHNIETMSPKRVVFGSRKRYAQKDTLTDSKTEMQLWKQDFFLARHSSMTLPGRHTSKHGNFLCRYEDGNLYVTCMDGKVAVFYDFWPVQYQDEYLSNFNKPSKERQSICYNFQLKRDPDGRFYIIPSVTITMEAEENSYLDHGCVSMDINWDHLALSLIDVDGNRIGGKIIPLRPEGKTSGQVTDMVGRAVHEVFSYCQEHQQMLIMEDIDLVMKRHTAKYGSHTGNRRVSLVTYAKILGCVENQSFRTKIPFAKVDPAYTSQAGKMLFMRKLGISIHSAASYTIGLRGLGKDHLLMPDKRLLVLIPEAKPKTYVVSDGTKITYPLDQFKHVWAAMTKAFGKIPKHRFYGKIPYDALLAAKRPSLKTVAAAMAE